MTLDIDDLERKARAAEAAGWLYADAGKSCFASTKRHDIGWTETPLYAELFDPPTALALIAEVRRLREAVKTEREQCARVLTKPRELFYSYSLDAQDALKAAAKRIRCRAALTSGAGQ